MRLAWVAVSLASACYSPARPGACTATCDFDGLGSAAPCPDGLACVAGGLCGEPGGGCGPGGPIDARVDAPACSGPLLGDDLLYVCLKSQPSTSVTLPAAPIDTDSSSFCDHGQALVVEDLDHCVIVGTDIDIAGNVHAKGSRPLVLAAYGTITIDFTLDASSQQFGVVGAAGNWIGCDAASTDGTNDGGGAGGSFQGKGGDGAAVITANAGTAAHAIGVGIHGGCMGGTSNGGLPGAGGGALYLIARGTINLNGQVLAVGGGGGGGNPGKGGAGGGAGGFIGLDAATLSLGNSAVVVASGGGGGGGGGSMEAGMNGREPSLANGWIGSGGTGGVLDSPGTAGGLGNAPTSPIGSPGKPANAGMFVTGGGGGGGGGWVRIFAPSRHNPASAVVAPPPTP